MVSSYTPTIRALTHARVAGRDGGTADRRSLIVAMPETPNEAALPNVLDEVERVRALLPAPTVLIPGTTPGRTPTRANVLAHLPDCQFAHFACHGAWDIADPSASRLLLQDHEEQPFTVASLAPVRLDRARLAYLSACRTAFAVAGDLVDEAIHLTTAFQLAGFPQVIGTQWEIDDSTAVEVAGAVYSRLRSTDGAWDVDRAPLALHLALRELRDRLPRTPYLWAAYLHAGA